MCSYCVVPFTRGRERSRETSSIVEEINQLSASGVKECVLLGQNVNSYHDTSNESKQQFPNSSYSTSGSGFNNMYKSRNGAGARFADLLEMVSAVDPEMRIRFTSPHPKDFPIEVLELVRDRSNICSSLHLPAQSGNNTVLSRMRRGYTREAYIELVGLARDLIPGVSVSSDFISGFCGETEEQHQDTITLMKHIRFDQAFMYAYSTRSKTHANHNFIDDVPEEVKQNRLRQVIETFRDTAQIKNDQEVVDQLQLVLIDGFAKKSSLEHPILSGRTDSNKRILFDLVSVPSYMGEVDTISPENTAAVLPKQGDYVIVRVNEARGHILRGTCLGITNIASYNSLRGMNGVAHSSS